MSKDLASLWRMVRRAFGWSEAEPPPEVAFAICAVCGKWPVTLRQTMRDAITAIPADKPVCYACILAFRANTHRGRKRNAVR
jgi:hypothetical protein